MWAVAITLRLALVENLRRLAITIARARARRDEADKLADKLLEIASLQPTGVMSFLNERFGKREDLPHPFLVQLVQRLREQHPSVMPVMDWIEKLLVRQGTSIEQIIHLEHQRQAAAQVTVGNIITSMRLLSTLDWNDFFEKVSLIEPLLGKDPAGVYSRMEFASRDRYRHVIERISKRTHASELKIAQAAIDLAAQADENSRAQRHVGYYLIDYGLSRLESSFSYQPRPTERLRRFLLRHSTGTYLGTLTLMTLLIMSLLLYCHVSPRSRVAIHGLDGTAGPYPRKRSGSYSPQLGSDTLFSAAFAAANGYRRWHSGRCGNVRRRANDLPARVTGS